MANLEKIFNSLQVDDIYNRTGVHVRKGGSIPDYCPKYSQKKQRYFPNQTGFKFSKMAKSETVGMAEIEKRKAKNTDRIYPQDTQYESSNNFKSPSEVERDRRVMQLTAQNPGMRFDIKVPAYDDCEYTNEQTFYNTNDKYFNDSPALGDGQTETELTATQNFPRGQTSDSYLRVNKGMNNDNRYYTERETKNQVIDDFSRTDKQFNENQEADNEPFRVRILF